MDSWCNLMMCLLPTVATRLLPYLPMSVLPASLISVARWDSPCHHGVIRRNVNKLGAAQNVNRCIYKGQGRLPRPSKSHLQKTKPNLQMALSGTGQSALPQVDTSVHILGCTQLVNVSSNHAMAPFYFLLGSRTMQSLTFHSSWIPVALL